MPSPNVPVQIAESLPAGSNALGTVEVTNTVDIAQTATMEVTEVPTTTNGTSIYRSLDVDENGVNIKASAGKLYGYHFYNNAATTRYLKFYNKASAPTVGTDVPVLTFPLPAGSAANMPVPGAGFNTGIGIGATTGIADNDTGAPATNDVVVNVYYF